MAVDIRPPGYIPQGTFSGTIPSEKNIERRQKLADLLAQQGMETTPLQSPWQALARVAQSAAGAYGNYQAGQMEQQRNSALAEALKGNISPEQVIEMGLRSGDVTMADVLAYQAKKRQDDATKYGLNPVWALGSDKKYHLFQTNQGGGPPAEVQFPSDMAPQPQAGYLDTATGFVPYSKVGGGILNPGATPGPAPPPNAGTAAPLDINTTGAADPPPAGVPHPLANPTPTPAAPAEVPSPGPSASGVIPKDIAGQQRAQETGTAGGKAASTLSAAEGNAHFMQNALDDLQISPGFDYAAGDAVRGSIPEVYGDQATFVKRFNTVKSKRFLQAYDYLRGAGAITEQEGQAGAEAIAGLSRNVPRAELERDIGILRDVVTRGILNARQKARMGTPTENIPQHILEGRDAIAKGGDRAAIIKETIRLGLDPTGL